MSTKFITWAELKEIINKLPENILNQNATVWNGSEDAGSAVVGVKLLNEDWHYDGDEGCAPISIIKENYDDYEENKDTYRLVHATGTPILIIPDNTII